MVCSSDKDTSKPLLFAPATLHVSGSCIWACPPRTYPYLQSLIFVGGIFCDCLSTVKVTKFSTNYLPFGNPTAKPCPWSVLICIEWAQLTAFHKMEVFIVCITQLSSRMWHFFLQSEHIPLWHSIVPPTSSVAASMVYKSSFWANQPATQPEVLGFLILTIFGRLP